MKTGVIIPYRNDRPLFLEHLKYMLSTQTVQPDVVKFVDHEPESEKVDITQRYKRGYEELNNQGVILIFLMEVDDYYAPDYIEQMLYAWNSHGRPNIFGTNYTIYYHLKLRKYLTMNHHSRASAMNTMLRSKLPIKWCPDHEPYTDLHLWKQLKGVTFTPPKILSIGMKHGVGKLGGRAHVDWLERYKTNDENFDFLKYHLTSESFKFYSTYFNDIPS